MLLFFQILFDKFLFGQDAHAKLARFFVFRRVGGAVVVYETDCFACDASGHFSAQRFNLFFQRISVFKMIQASCDNEGFPGKGEGSV